MVGVFPGSFTNFHKGHQHLLERATKVFDKVIVLVVNNPEKKNSSSLNQRFLNTKKTINKMKLENVQVDFFSGFTIDYMKRNNLYLILRGIRNDSDLFYEQKLAKEYWKQNPEIEILYFLNKI